MQLTCFTNILENFDHLKDSGILTNERIEEIKEYISDKNFVPVELKDGREIKNWTCHKPSGTIWTNTIKREDGWGHFVYESILSHLLTEEEIDRINKDASSYYLKEQEKRRFEKAEKIPAAEWDGPVYWNEYYTTVDECIESQKDLWDENDGEFELPKYVWACDKVEPICHLDYYYIVESATEDNSFEDWDIDELKGKEELMAALDKFNELNKNQVSWYSNEKIAVIL